MEARIELPPKLIGVFVDRPGEFVRYRGAYGGRGSGKTRSFALMAAIRGYEFGATGREGVILCGREFMNSLDESSMEEIKAAIRAHDWLAAYYEIGEKFIRSKDGRIRFVFASMSRNVDSVKSKSRVLLAWVDEAEPVSDESWRKLLPTIREDGSELWVTWNPESEDSATHKRFRENPPEASKIVEINWRDNPWFPAVLDFERRQDERLRPDSYAHIWEGAFNTVREAAYFARWIEAAEAEGRIGDFPPDPMLPVVTAWDIGVRDYTAIWFIQEDGARATVVDYYEAEGLGAQQIVEQAMPEYAESIADGAARLIEMGRTRPFRYAEHWLPHDVRVREWGAGARQRVEVLRELGLRGVRKGANAGPDQRIEATRQLLPTMRFHATPRVRLGIKRLRNYQRRWNRQLAMWEGPLHDENSHGADAFGEYAVNRALIAAPAPKAITPPVLEGGVRIGPPEHRSPRRIVI